LIQERFGRLLDSPSYNGHYKAGYTPTMTVASQKWGLFQKPHDFFQAPKVIGNSRFHRRSNAQRLVNLNKDAASRYSPAEAVKVETHRIFGNPIKELISTSHLERQNLTLRMHCRRLTRLTNAFSKKFENFKAAVALNFAYYNFCKIHGAIRCTPAMAAGVEKSQWSVAELVERCGE